MSDPKRDLAEKAHTLTCEVQDEPRMFRAVCSCGWAGAWATTNACMGRGRRHVAAMRRRSSNPPGQTPPTQTPEATR